MESDAPVIKFLVFLKAARELRDQFPEDVSTVVQEYGNSHYYVRVSLFEEFVTAFDAWDREGKDEGDEKSVTETSS